MSLFKGSRRAIWAALLLLLAIPLTSLSGCSFQQPPAVAETPEKAFEAGEAKEADARVAVQNGDVREAVERWNNVATYYGAVASKFAGTDAGLKAVLEQTDALAEGANNPQGAQMILKNAIKQYNRTRAPQTYPLALTAYEELIRKVDEANSHTIPYKVMDALVRLFGNDVRVAPIVAIFAIALIVTLVLWPLRVKQYQSMKEMQRWMPEMQRIQAKYKNDPQLLMQKQQQFYKDHNINQFAGCLPMLLQMPVIWFMYQVILNYQFHFANTHFLWINPQFGEASASWPWPLTHAVGHNLGESDLLLLLLYAVSMYLQTKLMPTTPPSDPAQAETQRLMTVMMPGIFFVMMLQWQLASAFVLYWFASNVFSVIQSKIILQSLPDLPPLVLKSEGGESGAETPSSPATSATTVNEGGKKPAGKRLVSPKTRRRVQKK